MEFNNTSASKDGQPLGERDVVSFENEDESADHVSTKREVDGGWLDDDDIEEF